MPSEELLINIIAKLQGGGFEESIANLKNVQNQTSSIDGSSPYINPTVVGDATDKLREVQKKANEIAAEKTLVNIGVATEGLEEIKKIKTEYKALKNLVPPKFRVEMDNIAGDKIDELRKKINDLDGLSPQIKTMVESGAIDELKAIQTATENLDGLSPVIKPTVDDSEALGALKNIQNQIDNLGGVESAIGGAVGAFGLEQMLGGGLETAQGLDKSWRSWVGKIQHSGESLKDAKVQADNLSKSVNKFASQGQSNDQFFKNIAGTVINANTSVSDSMLGMTERVISGYELMRGASGDTLYEMEKELQQYLTTGATERLTELESIGGGKWMPLLKEADTVEERIKVLNDMLTEEGVMGALNVDAPTKSLDQLKATLEANFTDIGSTLINIAKPIADFFLGLDDATGGVSTTLLVVVGVVGLLAMTFVGFLGIAAPAIPILVGMGGAFTVLGAKMGIVNTVSSASIIQARAHATAMGMNTTAIGANTGAQGTNLMARIRSIPALIGETGAKVANTAATTANTVAERANAAAAWIVAGATTIVIAARNGELITLIANTAGKVANTIATYAMSAASYVAATGVSVLNAIMMANPYVLVAIAIVALVAVLWHLYNTNESVRNAINGFFNALRGLGAYIAGAFGNTIKWLGDRFIELWGIVSNNPTVQFIAQLLTWISPLTILIFHFNTVKKSSEDLWKGINNAVKDNPLLNLLTWISPITILLFHFNDLKLMASALKQAWDEFTNSAEGQELFSSLGEAFAELQSAGSELMSVFGELWNVLFPPDVSSKSSAAKNGVDSVRKGVSDLNPFLEIAKALIGGVAWVLSNVVIPGLRGAAIVFRNLAAGVRFVSEVLSPLINFLQTYIGVLWGVLSGNISLQEGLTTIWNNIGLMIVQILMAIINNVGSFVATFNMSLLTGFGAAVNGAINWFAQLPGRLWGFLLAIITRVISFGANLNSKFRSIFSSAVNTAKSFLSKLPGIAWQEMMNVAAKIGGAANHIFAQVKATFGNVVYWAKKVLGIASPGFIARAIGGEMDHVADFIINGAGRAYNAAKRLGDKIVDGFGNPVLPSIGNEGIDPFEYDPKNPNPSKWPFPFDPTDFPIPTGGPGGLVIKESSKSDDRSINVTVKNNMTLNIEGGGDPEEVAQQIEQKLATQLPANIMEALIKALNNHNVSNGNI